MIFILKNNGKVKISEEAIDRMRTYQQISQNDLEAGGTMLGRYLIDSNNIIIDKVTIPMVGDIRKRMYFKKQEKRHQKIIEKAWIDSDGTCNYIGEWHTHPEWYPTPSSLDKKEWIRKLSEDSFDDQYLYFVIVGIKAIRMWRGDKQTLKIKRIDIDE